MATGYGLGVDLGTTYTAAAVYRDGHAKTAVLVPAADRPASATEDDVRWVPSALFLHGDEVLLVGNVALQRGVAEPERLARDFMRTERFGDDDVAMLLGDREATPAELAALLLRWVVDTVTDQEGAPPEFVTLTHPVTWQKHRTGLLVKAAAGVELDDVGLVAEPVAAAAYHAATERLETGELLAVYDLGGRSFQATVVRKTASGFDVEGRPAGDPELGGRNFDEAVMQHIAAVLGVAWRTLDENDPTVRAALARVRDSAIRAKQELSSETEATIHVELPEFTRDVRLTRGEFESAIRIPVLQSLDLLTQAIESAGVAPTDLHSVLLVGGSSRVPLISRLISSKLGLDVSIHGHPKFAVCLGAAILAGARLATSVPAGAVPAPPPELPQLEPEPVVEPPSAPEVPIVEPVPAPPDTRLAATPLPVAVEIDLARTGISTAVDTLVRPEPAPLRWAPVVTTRDEPLTITHVGDRRRGVRTAVVAVLLALALVAVLIVIGGAVG